MVIKTHENRNTLDIVWDQEEYLQDNRPPCPECESGHIKNHGPQWHCLDCGRRWMKKRREKKYLKHNINCPECKGEVISHGVRWLCKSCGRTFTKHYREEKK
jgi:tRNA(Ile2) C34 agmatinyltransferase TiaS